MSDQKFNSSAGVCTPASEVVMALPLSQIMMGFTKEFIDHAFQAVHINNRLAKEGDFVGINFPEINLSERSTLRFGTKVMLIGSEKGINAVLNQDVLSGKFDFVKQFEPIEHYPVEGCNGQALVRNQNRKGNQVSTIKRKITRAKKRGKSTDNLEEKLSNLISGKTNKLPNADLFITLNGSNVPAIYFDVKEIKASSSPMVTTYGLSSGDRPLVIENTLNMNLVCSAA
jgi:hypothetical protein